MIPIIWIGTMKEWMAAGPALTLTHDILFVILSDKIPCASTDPTSFMWMAEQDPDYGFADFLPDSWFPVDESALHFNTLEDAYSWASAQAIKWARSEAARRKEKPKNG